MLKIRKVTLEDSALILNWRNNPEVYRYALNPFPVASSDHEKWFASALKNPLCVFYMGIFDGVPCGSVRYQLTEDEKEAEVSISLAPEFWGRGIACIMMSMAEEFLKRETSVRVVHATVLNDNKGSMRLFEKANFSPRLTRFIKKL